MNQPVATATEKRDTDLKKEIKSLRFDVERSIRYHSRRRAFFEQFGVTVNAFNLIMGSGAVVALIDDRLPDLVVGLGAAAVAIISFINLVVHSAENAALHARLQQRFIDLMKNCNALDENGAKSNEKLRRCRDERLNIERDEPPIYRVVDLLAHNELATAQGASSEHIYYIHPWKALTANFWRYEVSNPKSLAVRDSEEKSRAAKGRQGREAGSDTKNSA